MSGFFGGGKAGPPTTLPCLRHARGRERHAMPSMRRKPHILDGRRQPLAQPPAPHTSPATYGILAFSCLLYIVSLLATIRTTGLQPPGGGGIFALLGIGASAVTFLHVSARLTPLPADLVQPWRLIMATFLHGSLMHIVFNMWVLMDIGPQIEELYGSARFFFIYVVTGIGGYLLSSTLGGHFSVGGSGALLGLIGVLLAITTGPQKRWVCKCSAARLSGG